MMRKTFTITAVLLLGALLTLPGVSAQKSSRDAKQKPATIEGCLTGPNEQNVYVLANEKDCCILLEGEPDMSPHVGHKVKLTGEWAKGPEALRGRENIAGKKVEEGKKVPEERSPEQRYFKVTKVEQVADTCALPPAEEKPN